MEPTVAGCLAVSLAAVLLAVRARRKTNDLERAVQDALLRSNKLLHENAQLRNRMDIQKLRLKNVESEVASWRASLSACAAEHFDLSEQIQDLGGERVS